MRIELEKRIEEFKNIRKMLDLVTDDLDERDILDDIEGTLDEAIFFYEEKLEKGA